MSKPKTLDDIEQTLTIDEFMKVFGLKSRATFHAWRRGGVMKTMKVGKFRRVPVSEVVRLQREHTKYVV